MFTDTPTLLKEQLYTNSKITDYPCNSLCILTIVINFCGMCICVIIVPLSLHESLLVINCPK